MYGDLNQKCVDPSKCTVEKLNAGKKMKMNSHLNSIFLWCKCAVYRIKICRGSLSKMKSLA